MYYDTVETLGHFTELWGWSESFIEFQRSVKQAAWNWDGSNPVRHGANVSSLLHGPVVLQTEGTHSADAWHQDTCYYNLEGHRDF